MATELEMIKIMAILTAAYPHAKLVPGTKESPGTLDVYALMLADLDVSELLAAVKYCIATHPDFLPSVATIRAASAKLRAGGQSVSGADAWGKVLRAIRDIGLYGVPEFDDPDISRSVDCLGWRVICLSDEQDFATRAHFIKAYEAYKARRQEVSQLAVIPEAARIMSQLAERLEPSNRSQSLQPAMANANKRALV